MKIIDLLNKIANGEEVPKKFKYEDLIIKRDKIGNYIDNDGDMFTDSILTDFSNLNDEIEILEKKKIPEKIKIDDQDRIQATSTGNFIYKVNQPTKNIISKINEIIKYLESRDKE